MVGYYLTDFEGVYFIKFGINIALTLVSVVLIFQGIRNQKGVIFGNIKYNYKDNYP